LLFLSRFVIKPTGLNDLVVDVKLIASTGVHSFLDTLLCDEAQNSNGFCLTYSMGTILGLEIGVRIPEMIVSL
jgi:hypothetical protein